MFGFTIAPMFLNALTLLIALMFLNALTRLIALMFLNTLTLLNITDAVDRLVSLGGLFDQLISYFIL